MSELHTYKLALIKDHNPVAVDRHSTFKFQYYVAHVRYQNVMSI
jgi:hypothetical protein